MATTSFPIVNLEIPFRKAEVVKSTKRLVNTWKSAGWDLTKEAPVPLGFIICDLLTAAGIDEAEIQKIIGKPASQMIGLDPKQ